MLRFPIGAFIRSLGGGGIVSTPPRIALTGTPGTGKSTCARLLSPSGYSVISIEELASSAGALDEIDKTDDARPVDIELLLKYLEESWKSSPQEPVIIDGHLSHHLPTDAVVVLRCEPETLRTRLEQRDYSEAKIMSNVEWELLGGAWNEKQGNSVWMEFNTTDTSAERVVEDILNWISDGFKPMSPEAVIDWVG
jgi:adenylate kinase|tara:strand:+ start:1271 stop:1855 length:585 start_codon:yes stop_codon:yes gene_type:complete